MGSLLHIVDYSQDNMAKKVVREKRQVDGLEAPRNSLELPVEAYQSFHSGGDNIMYAYHVPYNWTEMNHYSTEAPMKKLISEEISKRQNTKHSAPSVIARLMGVDMLPSEAKPVARKIEKKNGLQAQNFSKENLLKNGSIGHVPCTSKSSRHKKSSSFDCIGIEGSNCDRWNDSTTLDKPRPREHPQEEELQKFKKEFEAWQAARMKECSKVIELGSTPSQWLAQENLNKEKMVLYSNSKRLIENKKPIELNEGRMTVNERGSSHNKDRKSFENAEKECFYVRKRSPSVDFNLPPVVNSGEEFDAASAPSKIVILRPGPDTMGNCDESWASSPCISEERGSIEDFLEEVKERLKCELQGKSCKRSTTVRGGGIETPYSEKPSDPKQIAQRIAKEVRESVTRDLGMNLFRSESTRSYRSEIQFNGTGSPEFISRDTRRFLAERLRNVLKEETHRHVPVVARGSTRTSMLNNERRRTEQPRDILNGRNKLRYWDIRKDELDMQSRSFRREPNDNAEIHEELSPRNLIRSLSAPVSGTSFGKLLLEDRHMLTGAHIRRKHEAIENGTVNVKKQKKEKFNLREKVTSLRYSFTLKGRLFGRKIQSFEEQQGNKQDCVKDVLRRPTMMMSFYDRHENPTEVPPSPASVCSSVHEEFWRPAEYFSPTSISDVASIDDSMMSNVFKEISSNLKELRRQLNQLETDGSEDAMNDEQPTETDMIEIEDQTEAYVRDLLLISGLYDGSYDKSLAKWDPLGKPITNQVFEEVEESYKQKNKDDDEGSAKDQGEKSNHKIVFDLLNEALPNVLGQNVSMSKFMRKATNPVARPLRGRKLLEQVWQTMRIYIYPPAEKSFYSIDTMVTRDLQSSPWSRLMHDDVHALGKDMESQIFGYLIDEIVKDMQSEYMGRKILCIGSHMTSFQGNAAAAGLKS
ncbi:hypothetical protein ACH5RR_011958 [Cinchona calisaya]|uniref:DUF4378 domain-containing protein n=1 Tax=Cinchona calisaya TaxID=153742 RepID=A0ABD3A8Z2_9GENT